MAEIEVVFSDEVKGRIDNGEIEDLIRRAALAALEMENEDGVISVLVTGDEEIRKLNKTYLNADRPTDVLAFSMMEGEEVRSGGEGRILGDVVISVDTAVRQAQEYGNTLHEEIALLIVHGVLHLLGYDDQDEEGSAVMRRKEAEALLKLERR